MRVEIKDKVTGEVYVDRTDDSENITMEDVFADAVAAAGVEPRPSLILSIWGDDGLLASVQELTRD
jgi:hypothetical protein